MRRIPGTDLAVSPFAIDGSVFGWASGATETARLLDAFVASGGNLVSTADHYAGGRSEVMIGAWLKTLADRASAVVATKVGRHPDAAGLSARAVERAVEASLRRLDTDHIDLLSLDGEDPATPIDETLEALDMLRRAGKVRYLSASGFPGERIREVTEFAAAAVYPTFRTVAAVYNLMQRKDYETDLAPVVRDLGLGVIARLPLASGFLFGAVRRRADEPASPIFAGARSHIGKRGDRVLDALDAVAAEVGDSGARVALAWVQSKPCVVATAIPVNGVDQLSSLLEGGELTLTRHHLALLDKVSA